MPESFNVLVKEIRSLGIDIELGERERRGQLTNECCGGSTLKDLLNLLKSQTQRRV